MALKNLAKGLTIRGLIIDARVLRLLPGETLAKRVEAPRSPLAMLSEEHTWARDRVKGMRGSEIREELTQRGAPVDGEPWELEASLARLLAESGPQAAPSARPSTHDSMISRVDAETRGDAAFAPDAAEGSVRAKYMAALGAKKKAMGAAMSLPGGAAAAAQAADGRSGSEWAQVEQDLALALALALAPTSTPIPTPTLTQVDDVSLQPGVKEFLLYLEKRGMVCALLPSEAEGTIKDEGASLSVKPSGGFFGSFFGSKQPEQPEQAAAAGKEGKEGKEGEKAGSSHEGVGEREGAALTKQLQAPPFAHVLGAGGAAGVRRSEPAHIPAACAALGLPPGAVMLVSDHARALGAARSARTLSCYMLKQVASAPKRLPSDPMSKLEPSMATQRGPKHRLLAEAVRGNLAQEESLLGEPTGRCSRATLFNFDTGPTWLRTTWRPCARPWRSSTGTRSAIARVSGVF